MRNGKTRAIASMAIVLGFLVIAAIVVLRGNQHEREMALTLTSSLVSGVLGYYGSK